MTNIMNQFPSQRHGHPFRKEEGMSVEHLKQQLLTPPTEEELARRQAVFARIMAHRREAVISPLTTADLVHHARQEESDSYGGDR